MGVVLEVRVFPLIGAVTPMTVGLNIPAVGSDKNDKRQEWLRLVDGKNSIGHCG